MSCTAASSTPQICESRLLQGSTPTSGGTDYKFFESGLDWAGNADNTAGNGQAYWFIFRSTNFFMGTVEIQNPFEASLSTTFQSTSQDSAQRVASGGYHAVNASYDGIQFKVALSTLQGQIFSYGYRTS